MRNPVSENLAVAAVALEDASRWLQDETSPDDVARALVDMVEVKRLAARVYDDIEKHLLSLMPERRIEVPGVGLVEAKRSRSYKQWDNAELFKHVVARALDERKVDHETGEVEREADAVSRVLFACARPSWRVTALRALGLDESEFCVVEENDWSIKVSAPEKPAVPQEDAA